MTPTHERALPWAADGAAYLRGMLTRMGDEAFAKPSSLPNWTRAHVLTHVAAHKRTETEEVALGGYVPVGLPP